MASEVVRTTEPLPCPFCGGTDLDAWVGKELSTDGLGAVSSVTCLDCEADGPAASGKTGDEAKEAGIAAWNRALRPAGEVTNGD